MTRARRDLTRSQPRASACGPAAEPRTIRRFAHRVAPVVPDGDSGCIIRTLSRAAPRCGEVETIQSIVAPVLGGVLLLAVPLGDVRAEEQAPPREAAVEASAEWPEFSTTDADAGLSMHREMYALPLTTSNVYNGDESDVVFRLSVKLRILGSRFFFAYTQDSFWQAFDRSESSPFRETNYDPEVFYRIVPANSSLRRWGAEVGLEHTSNGQSEPDSRSWNRVYGTVHRVEPRWVASLKLWHRIEEDRCPIGEDGLEIEECRDDASYDDNPDLTDFMGYGELHLRFQWRGHDKLQRVHLMARGNTATGKGAFSADYSYPAGTKDLHWFAKLFHGYGESLIDYDRSITRVGVGVLLRR